MSQIRDFKDFVQDIIDKGATSVEEVHKSIADMPLEALSQIPNMEEPIKAAREFQNNTIGSAYELIRSVNQRAGEVANQLLDTVGQ